MKAPKITEDDLTFPHQAPITHSRRSGPVPIRCQLVLEKLSDFQFCIKKNSLHRKITFPGETKLRLSNIIIKRNSKYLRKFEPNFNKFGAKLSSLQQIKSLKKLNLLIEFSVFMSMNFPFLTGKITIETIKSILTVLFRAGFTLDHLSSSLFIFNHVCKHAKHKISRLKTLKITSNTMVTFTDNLFKATLQSQDSELLELLPNLTRFKHLTSLDLHFQDILHKEGFFFEIFENLGMIKTLRALSVRIKLDHVGKKILEKGDIIRQVDQLESLSLFLDFGQYNKCFGNLFSSLVPLVNLKKLKLILISQNNCDCSSLATFITSLKNLQTLKIRSCHLLWKQYKTLLKAIRQLEGLRKISLRQIRQNLPWTLTSEFSYKSVYKTIQNLPLLSSMHLDLSNYALTPREILAFPGFLYSIPLLERAKICLRFGADHTSLYNFNLAFYDDIKKLLTKLKSLNIMLIEFPERLIKKIEKTLSPQGRKSRDYMCQVVTINDIRADFDLLDNNPVLY